MQRAWNKDLGIEEVDTKASSIPLRRDALKSYLFCYVLTRDESCMQEEPTFPLVNVPDHMLNEEDLKEKRRQRLMKAGYDARIRQKAERDEARLREAEERRLDEEMRSNDPQGWLEGLRQKHQDAMERIKERKKRKEQLSDRKSLAAQNRMKSIAELASDAKAPKKRKRVDKGEFRGLWTALHSGSS